VYRQERDATDLTPQWDASAEPLQRRADAKPLVSCSQKLAAALNVNRTIYKEFRLALVCEA
jgi:hypothetical protein